MPRSHPPLAESLHPVAVPIAITFLATSPDDVPAFEEAMPSATEDGRTGRVPAGCVFWVRAAEGTFSTMPADHRNCSVGSLTHGLLSLEEAAGNADISALLEAGWVTPDVCPVIPTVTSKPASIVYGPLAETPIDPDVVLLRLSPKAVMVVKDAWPGVSIEGKPQCHIVAIAKEQKRVAASVGCALSRARTGMSATEMTCAIPGSMLAEFVDSVERTATIDRTVATYAAADARRFKPASGQAALQ
jgi:uncharacterized protein (DUF169 family)